MYEGLICRDIEFVPWCIVTPEERATFDTSCKKVVSLLQEVQSTFERNSILAGKILTEIEQMGIWKYVRRSDESPYSCYSSLYLKDSFFKFCERYFGLGKSTVYGLMQVYSRFGHETGTPLLEYKDYKYSQLLELCSMSPEDIAAIPPSMTVAEIKALKRKNKAQAKSSCISPFDKPDEKSETVEAIKLSAYYFPIDKKSEKKDEFKKLVKNMFEKFEYSLTLCGRKQGGQAFGGSLFDYLLEKGFFDADTTV